MADMSNPVIVFEREAFDEFLVQIAQRELLTPDLGEILNDLVAREVQVVDRTPEKE